MVGHRECRTVHKEPIIDGFMAEDALVGFGLSHLFFLFHELGLVLLHKVLLLVSHLLQLLALYLLYLDLALLLAQVLPQ